MATDPDKRAGERGLSLIEALVIVTITAMLALLLLPLASNAAGRNFARAERAIDAANAASAEREFRGLLRAAAQDGAQGLAGSQLALTFLASPDSATACVSAGPPTLVRLRILNAEAGGALVCEAQGRRRELLAWREGQARFVYSADAAGWTGAWSETGRETQTARGGAASLTRAAPFVRLEIINGEGPAISWSEQAGWTEPTRLDPEAAP